MIARARPEDVLRLAASLEANSLHPIAQAIGRAAQGIELATVMDFRSPTAQGVEGTVQGRRYRVGKPHLFPQRPPRSWRSSARPRPWSGWAPRGRWGGSPWRTRSAPRPRPP